MTKTKKATEGQQKTTALVLFLALVVVFGVSFYFLLAVQYQYPPWDKLDPAKAVDILKTLAPLKWVLASLIGASLYLLGQIANFYPKINEKPDPDNQNDFVNSIYWYISTLLRAPILTVVIMWLLTNLTINMGTPPEAASGTTPGTSPSDALGIAVNFAKFPDLVQIGIAFILGFYARVARKQLDIITQYLFTRAWAMAQMGFDLAATSPEVLLLKETYIFKTDPMMDVVWTATTGTMEADTGTYKAPEDTSVKNVIIRAQLRSEPSVTKFKDVKLRLFKITGKAEAAEKETIPLKLETKLDKIGDVAVDLKDATWSCDDKKAKLDKSKGIEVNFTAPELAGAAEKTVKVTATYNGNDTLPFEIKVKKENENYRALRK